MLQRWYVLTILRSYLSTLKVPTSAKDDPHFDGFIVIDNSFGDRPDVCKLPLSFLIFTEKTCSPRHLR